MAQGVLIFAVLLGLVGGKELHSYPELRVPTGYAFDEGNVERKFDVEEGTRTYRENTPQLVA